MASSIPAADTKEQFRAIRRDEQALGPVVALALERCAIPAAPAVRFEDGTLPVYAVGDDLVLKLYPRCCGDDARVERAVLELLAGRLEIPTPRLQAAGDAEGWSYLLMSRLRGESLAVAWREIPPAGRLELMEALGASLRSLHRLGVPEGPIPRPSWPDFVAAQRASATERQRRHGLGEAWLAQIDAFLAATPLVAGPTGLLHTEVMREHLLVERRGETWSLSGLFDFEPAMVGAAEYDLASIGVFVTGGEAPLLRRLLLACGYAPRDLGPALARRILAYLLLHQYSKLIWYLDRVPPPVGVVTLEELAEVWFGT